MVAFATATVGASDVFAASACTFSVFEHASLNRTATPTIRTVGARNKDFRVGVITARHSGFLAKVSPSKSRAKDRLARCAAPWIGYGPRLRGVRGRYPTEW